MHRRCLRLVGAMSVAMIFNACSGDDEAPARLPEKLEIQAPSRVEVGEPFRPVPSVVADDGLRHDWDFGDGQRSQQPQPVHAYSQPGRHQLALTLSNSVGDKLAAQASVQAGRFAPLAGRSCSAGPETGWCWQMPLPFGGDIYDVIFADTRHGWAAGEAGYLFTTVDGGLNWERVLTPMTEGIGRVQFADARNGWAVSRTGRRIMRSDDGGRHWIFVGKVPLRYIISLSRTPSGQLLATGYELLSQQTGSYLSDDGGASWNRLAMAVDVIGQDGTLWSERAGGYLSASFDRGLSFVQVSSGGPSQLAGSLSLRDGAWSYMAVRSNGADVETYSRVHRRSGESEWIETPIDLGVPSGGRLRRPVQMFPGGQGWAVVELGVRDSRGIMRTRVMRTADGGAHWVEFPIPNWLQAGEVPELPALDGRTLVVHLNGIPWMTVNGGSDWLRVLPPTETWGMPNVLKRSAAGHLVLGYNGWQSSERVYVSADEGASWSTLAGVPASPGSQWVVGLWFFDAETGLALRGDGSLLATDDGGRSWQGRPMAGWTLHGPAGSLQFTDDRTGWAIAGGALVRSTDLGLHWARVETPPALMQFEAQFLDARHGWIVGTVCDEQRSDSECSDALYSTRDGGAHWTRIGGLPFSDGDMKFRLVSEDVALAVTRHQIRRTADGGRSWSVIEPAHDFDWDPSALYFRNVREGWLIGGWSSSGGAMRTTDGGLTWQSVPLPEGTGPLMAVRFVDERRGWMVGRRGTVLRTDDGGQTWQLQASGTERDLEALFAIDAETAWIGGARSAILSTATGGR